MPPSAMPHTTRVCESVAARPSSTACVTVPRIATMKAAIIVLECPGSKPCRAPSRMALGMNNQACVAPCWSNSAKDGIKGSQVAGDFLELRHGLALFTRQWSDHVFQAVVKVILDQSLLGLL